MINIKKFTFIYEYKQINLYIKKMIFNIDLYCTCKFDNEKENDFLNFFSIKTKAKIESHNYNKLSNNYFLLNDANVKEIYRLNFNNCICYDNRYNVYELNSKIDFKNEENLFGMHVLKGKIIKHDF